MTGPPTRRALTVRRIWALGLVLVVAVAGCDASDGRTLPPPPDGATAPPATMAPVVELFTLSSAAVDDAGVLDLAHTCAGEGTSPPLAWSGAPPAAQLAVVARDRDAGTVHWVVGQIDPAVLGFGAGGLPEGAVAAGDPEALEEDHAAAPTGWVPPCPTGPGDLRTVDIALHALPEPVAIEPGLPTEVAAGLVEGTSVEVAVLVATTSG